MRSCPFHIRTWAGLKQDFKEVIAQDFEEAMRRDPDQQMRWVERTDSHDELLRQADVVARRHQVEITVAHGFADVLEYLRKRLMRCTHGSLSDEKPGSSSRAQAVLEGRISDVATSLRRAATRKRLSQYARQPVDQAADYRRFIAVWRLLGR